MSLDRQLPENLINQFRLQPLIDSFAIMEHDAVAAIKDLRAEEGITDADIELCSNSAEEIYDKLHYTMGFDLLRKTPAELTDDEANWLRDKISFYNYILRLFYQVVIGKYIPSGVMGYEAMSGACSQHSCKAKALFDILDRGPQIQFAPVAMDAQVVVTPQPVVYATPVEGYEYSYSTPYTFDYYWYTRNNYSMMDTYWYWQGLDQGLDGRRPQMLPMLLSNSYCNGYFEGETLRFCGQLVSKAMPHIVRGIGHGARELGRAGVDLAQGAAKAAEFVGREAKGAALDIAGGAQRAYAQASPAIGRAVETIEKDAHAIGVCCTNCWSSIGNCICKAEKSTVDAAGNCCSACCNDVCKCITSCVSSIPDMCSGCGNCNCDCSNDKNSDTGKAAGAAGSLAVIVGAPIAGAVSGHSGGSGGNSTVVNATFVQPSLQSAHYTPTLLASGQGAAQSSALTGLKYTAFACYGAVIVPNVLCKTYDCVKYILNGRELSKNWSQLAAEGIGFIVGFLPFYFVPQGGPHAALCGGSLFSWIGWKVVHYSFVHKNKEQFHMANPDEELLPYRSLKALEDKLVELNKQFDPLKIQEQILLHLNKLIAAEFKRASNEQNYAYQAMYKMWGKPEPCNERLKKLYQVREDLRNGNYDAFLIHSDELKLGFQLRIDQMGQAIIEASAPGGPVVTHAAQPAVLTPVSIKVDSYPADTYAAIELTAPAVTSPSAPPAEELPRRYGM